MMESSLGSGTPTTRWENDDVTSTGLSSVPKGASSLPGRHKVGVHRTYGGLQASQGWVAHHASWKGSMPLARASSSSLQRPLCQHLLRLAAGLVTGLLHTVHLSIPVACSNSSPVATSEAQERAPVLIWREKKAAANSGCTESQVSKRHRATWARCWGAAACRGPGRSLGGKKSVYGALKLTGAQIVSTVWAGLRGGDLLCRRSASVGKASEWDRTAGEVFAKLPAGPQGSAGDGMRACRPAWTRLNKLAAR